MPVQLTFFRALFALAAIDSASESLASSPGAVSGSASEAIAAAYQGHWRAHFVGTATNFSRPFVRDQEIVNQCDAVRGQATCRQSVDGKPSATLIFTRTAGRPGHFEVRTVPAGGVAASVGQLLIADRQWTYPWHEKHDGHWVAFRVVNRFVTPDRIAFSKQYRAASGGWQTLSRGSEVRLPENMARRPPSALGSLPAPAVYRVGTAGKLYIAPMVDENGKTVQFLTPGGLIGRAKPTRDGSYADASPCPNRFVFRDDGRAVEWATCHQTWRGVRQVRVGEHRLSVEASDGVTVGASIFSAEGRQRAAIVLAHGADTETRDMGVIVPILAEAGLKVVAFDQRGSGETAGDWRSAGIRQISDDMVSLAKRVADDPAICRVGFYGFSNGGWIAPTAAKFYGRPTFIVIKSGDSETIAANVAYETFAAVNKAAGPQQASLARSVMATLLTALESDRAADWAKARAALVTVDGAPWRKLTQLPNASSIPLSDSIKAAYRRQLIYDPESIWRSLDAPALVLLGERDLDVDAPASAAGFRRFYADRPHLLSMSLFPDAGHQLVTSPEVARDNSMATGHLVPQFQPRLSGWLGRHAFACDSAPLRGARVQPTSAR